jgi:hypothetical protein
LALWVGSIAVNLSAGTVNYEFTVLPFAPPADAPAGSSMLQVTYLLSNFTFEANQELDIQFDPTLFGELSNGTTPSGFIVNLFQPNNPPGAPGDFSALNTSGGTVTGSFSVDAVYLGSGSPGPQTYTIDQFDSQGNFVAQVSEGSTTPSNGAVPEPGSAWLGGSGLAMSGVWWMIRRRARRVV